MQVLVLWAHGGSANLGVAALAQGSEALLRRAWPSASLTFADFGAARPERLALGTRRYMLRERLTGRLGTMEWLGSFDVVWDTRSGDSFTDIYGPERHRVMSTVYSMATAAGAMGILAPQTIGPFSSSTARRRASRTLRSSAAVFARDPVSADTAAELGRPVDDTVADLVFALEPVAGEPSRDVLLNVSGLLWNPNPHLDHQAYRTAIHDLLRGLRSAGRTVTLLAHVLDSPTADNDVRVVKELAVPTGLDVAIPTSLGDARTMIAGSRLVVAARMHACLNALSLGVPALPMAYSRKFEPLLTSLGWDHGVDLRTSDDPVRRLLTDVDRSPELRVEAEHTAGIARASLAQLAERVQSLR